MRMKTLHAIPRGKGTQLDSCELDGSSPAWRAWLGYRRSHDFDQVPNNEGVGQDNAAMRADERFVVGVVSDGVSQSFYGDLAAGVVTDSLLDYLWANRQSPPEARSFREHLPAVEQEIAKAVDQFKIPSRVMEEVRAELEELRTRSGSQAVMAAFVLDRQKEGGSLTAYLVGDASLCAHVATQLAPLDPSPAWAFSPSASTADTILLLQGNANGRLRSLGDSDHHLVCESLSGVTGVAIYSDGVPADWGATLDGLDDPKSLHAGLDKWGARDDASLVAVLDPRHFKPIAEATRPLETPIQQEEPLLRPAKRRNPMPIIAATCAITALATIGAFRLITSTGPAPMPKPKPKAQPVSERDRLKSLMFHEEHWVLPEADEKRLRKLGKPEGRAFDVVQPKGHVVVILPDRGHFELFSKADALKEGDSIVIARKDPMNPIKIRFRTKESISADVPL